MPSEMTVNKIQEIGSQLKNYLRVNGLKQSEAAEALGVSDSQISQFCRGKYGGDAATLARKAIHYMNTTAMQRRSRKRVPEFVETTVARRIFTAIKNTEAFSNRDEAKICLIVGDAGHGKSKCLQQFAAVNTNSVYVRLDDTMASKAMFTAIGRELNLACKAKIDVNRPLHTIIEQIVELLEHRLMVILLDEASGLKVKALNQLRQVITVRAKRPLIVSGNNHLLTTINLDAGRCGNESLDQFRSRLLAVVDLDRLAAEGSGGGGKLHTVDDIRKLYEQLGIKLSKDATLALQKICRTPQSGRLRTCSHIIAALCVSPVIKKDELIDAEHIFSAIEYLGLPIRDRLPFTFGDVVEESRKSESAAKTG